MLEILFSPVLFILSLFTPKNAKIICFGSWYGEKFSDNSKNLFVEMNKNSTYSVFWITQSKKVYEDLKDKNFPVEYSFSFKGILLQLRAKTFIYTVNARDFQFGVITPRNKTFQLWHGSPLKKIGFDVEVNFFKSIIRFIRSKTTDVVSYIVSPSAFFDPVLSTAFRVNKEQIIRNGYPRCDDLFLPKKPSDTFKVAYLPTHRSEGADANLLLNIFKELLSYNHVLLENNVEIIFKPHFYDSKFFRKGLENNSNVKLDVESDTYNLLSQVDLLVTDFSSVFFDFDILDRPILFFSPDIESYQKHSRELYFNFSDIVSENHTELAMLLNKIFEISAEKDRNNQNSFGGKFNEDKNGNNSNLLASKIERILDAN